MLQRRLIWLAGVVLLWGAAIFWQLISLEVVHHQKYARMARVRQEMPVEIPAPRGTIFDRSGQALAMSVPTESIYVNPLKVPNLEVASELLSLALHMDRVDLYGKMKLAFDNHRGFLWVKRKITFDEGQIIRNLHQDWIEIQSESQRHYPGGTLAAHVLGSVDFEEKGNAGVEKALDQDLRGAPGHVRVLTDAKRRGIDSQSGSDARPGTPLQLTIDERLQFVADAQIAAAVKEHGAASGSVVVMNPNTGDILALSSYPAYDPNEQVASSGLGAGHQNHAIAVPFEPGSVFKVITLSAALETTNLRPESMINCNGGKLTLFGRTIHDSHSGMWVVPMSEVLAESSNVGAVQVGMRVGEERMYEYMRRFGFGQRTGVPIPGESKGRFRPLSKWSKASLPSVSMGQEVSVTTLQLARAASVIANGGLLVKPRLVWKKAGQPVPIEPPVRILKPETAFAMRQMMEGVVLHGTGKPAKLSGYSVGGKTGSAQIYDVVARRYSHNTYNGSFMGFAPLTNPAVVVVVTLNGTHGQMGFGAYTAAPVFRVVAAEALRILDVPKDLPDDEPPATLVAKNQNMDDVADADTDSTTPNILEDPEEDDAQPAVDPTATGPKVPNFRGMTMRAVLAEAAAKGLSVLPDGSGVARIQYPAPGARLHEGERIRVQFVR
jgi:cell division protein FtsI (penicillin-binding protein 3)